jgi:hypothetical protein
MVWHGMSDCIFFYGVGIYSMGMHGWVSIKLDGGDGDGMGWGSWLTWTLRTGRFPLAVRLSRYLGGNGDLDKKSCTLCSSGAPSVY